MNPAGLRMRRHDGKNNMAQSEFSIAAPVMDLDLGHLARDFQALEAAGVGELHFLVSDGVLSPDFTLGAAFVRTAKAACGLPCCVHLLSRDPSRHVDAFAAAGAGCIVVQAEVCRHGHRVLGQIRDAGVVPGVAVWPGTSLTRLDYLLPLAGRMLVMAAEPGAKRAAANTEERVRILRENIQYREYKTRIEVAGPIEPILAARLIKVGAQSLVLPPSLWAKDGGALEAQPLKAFREELRALAERV